MLQLYHLNPASYTLYGLVVGQLGNVKETFAVSQAHACPSYLQALPIVKEPIVRSSPSFSVHAGWTVLAAEQWREVSKCTLGCNYKGLAQPSGYRYEMRSACAWVACQGLKFLDYKQYPVIDIHANELIPPGMLCWISPVCSAGICYNLWFLFI